MKRIRLLTLFIALFAFVSLTACDSIVDDTIDPISSAGDEALNDPDEVDFLINGIRARSNNVQDNLSVQTSLISDQFIFGGANGGGATFPTFRDLMRGLPADTNPLNNNSVDGTQNHLGQYRFLADNLLSRAENLGAEAFGGTDDPRWQAAQFAGNFHGGIARYYWAAYFGETQRSGGGVISEIDSPADEERSEFIPSAQMYDLAVEKLDNALPFASEYEAKVINSVKARIALFQDDVSAAESFAENGLEPGDAPFQNQYVDRSGNQSNTWDTQGGIGRAQTVPAPRFFYNDEYLGGDFDAAESARIPLIDPDAVGIPADFGEVTEAGLLNREAVHPIRFDLGLAVGDTPLLPLQGRYPDAGADINFITWQENHLMLAEAAERSGDSAGALGLVNEVRGSYGVDTIDSADYDGLNTIFVERDKVTFTTGIRLVDQRRATEFNLDAEGLDLDLHGWHLDDNVWWYLPITLAERLNNPNLPNELP
ncbi:MAG: hypothetical protein PPP56_12910 [Longimonas sp.]|uniref:hypothetical protein n=1 Tax=Longimonas sp. TaxID=2039626 RepID=UPI00334AB67C